MREVLIIRQSAFGDILHLLPALSALKSAAPDLRIILLARDRFRFLGERAPFVDEVWTGVERPVETVVDCQGLMRTAWLAVKSGARVRGGYGWRDVREKPAALFYNRRVKVDGVHVSDRHAELLSGVLGVGARVDPAYRSDFLVREDPEVTDFLGEVPGPRLLVHPTSSQGRKHLSPHEWAPVLELFRQRGFSLLLSSGPGEERFLDPWEELVPGCVRVPVFRLESLPLLAAGCRFLAASDTGLAHLADQLGVPILSWYSLWPPERNGPRFSPRLIFHRRPVVAGEVREWLDALWADGAGGSGGRPAGEVQ